MIAKLEWTQSNAQQYIEQLQNSTLVVTLNKKSTTTTVTIYNRTTDLELRAAKAKTTGGFKCILLVPNFRPRFCYC